MKKIYLLLLGGFAAFCCTAQKIKTPEKIVSDTSIISVPLRGIKSTGVRGCDNCNVAGKLAQRLNLTSFTVDSLSSFKYNEKQNTLQVKYLISEVKGKIMAGAIMVSGPFGSENPHAGKPCLRYGFSCLPRNNRIGKTSYEIKTEGSKNFLVVTFLEDLKVEKGFFE